jgi:hypothetical protein
MSAIPISFIGCHGVCFFLNVISACRPPWQ